MPSRRQAPAASFHLIAMALQQGVGGPAAAQEAPGERAAPEPAAGDPGAAAEGAEDGQQPDGQQLEGLALGDAGVPLLGGLEAYSQVPPGMPNLM